MRGIRRSRMPRHWDLACFLYDEAITGCCCCCRLQQGRSCGRRGGAEVTGSSQIPAWKCVLWGCYFHHCGHFFGESYVICVNQMSVSQEQWRGSRPEVCDRLVMYQIWQTLGFGACAQAKRSKKENKENKKTVPQDSHP